MCQRAQDGHGTPCASLLLCGFPWGALHVATGQPDLGSGCLDQDPVGDDVVIGAGAGKAAEDHEAYNGISV